MKSTIGRPRAVTDEQIAAILTWHKAVLALETLRKLLKSLRQLCDEMHLSKGTIHYVVRRHGDLKQPSPEHRQSELRERRRRMKRVRVRAPRRSSRSST
jgi:NAD-dependent SIR2 family protein deacetylase